MSKPSDNKRKKTNEPVVIIDHVTDEELLFSNGKIVSDPIKASKKQRGKMVADKSEEIAQIRAESQEAAKAKSDNKTTSDKILKTDQSIPVQKLEYIAHAENNGVDGNINNDDGVLLRVSDLCVDFKIKRSFFGKPDVLSAVSHASIEIKRGQTFGLVGESGCGKSTLANAILGFNKFHSGQIEFDGLTLDPLSAKEKWIEARRQMQLVFQDPFGSLNPRFEVFRLISEPMYIRGERDENKLYNVAAELVEKVGLNASDLKRNIFEFSGGQRQRIAIARALCLKPKLIVLDEPVSALDVSVHSQICNLLTDLQSEFDLSYLFISHNLSVIKHMSTTMAVMYLGQIVEWGDSEKIFANPRHPYTKALMSAILEIEPSDRKRILLSGEVSSPINAGNSCRFCARCPIAKEQCKTAPIKLRDFDGHFSACPYIDED